jgi:hypothetical protein
MRKDRHHRKSFHSGLCTIGSAQKAVLNVSQSDYQTTGPCSAVSNGSRVDHQTTSSVSVHTVSNGSPAGHQTTSSLSIHTVSNVDLCEDRHTTCSIKLWYSVGCRSEERTNDEQHCAECQSQVSIPHRGTISRNIPIPAQYRPSEKPSPVDEEYLIPAQYSPIESPGLVCPGLV